MGDHGAPHTRHRRARHQHDDAASGFNDVVRIYNNTQRDGVRSNLAYIGSGLSQKLPEPFDQGYMRALFDYGYQRARRGYDWAKTPPGF